MNNNTNNNMHNNMNNNQIKPTPTPNPVSTGAPISTPTPAKVEVPQFKGLENKEKVAGDSFNKIEDNGKDKKNKIISIIILLVIVLGIFMLSNKKSDAPLVSTVAGCAEGDDFSQTSGEPCFPEDLEPCKEGEEFNKETGVPCSTVNASDNETALTPSISLTIPSSYDNALAEYKNKSVLFDMNCVATPAVLEVPLGTRILVANNSTEKTLKFKIPNRTEDLSPLHFMLSSSFNTIGEFGISCNGKDSAVVKVK